MKKLINKISVTNHVCAVILIALFIIPVSAIADDSPKMNYRLKWLFNTSVVGD